MDEQPKMGAASATMLLSIMIWTKVFLTVPRLLLEQASTAAWLAVLVKIGFTFALMGLLVRLYKGLEGRSLLDLCPKARPFVALLLLVYLFCSAVLALSIFGGALRDIKFPQSPVWFLFLFFVLAAALSARMGLAAQLGPQAVTFVLTAVSVVLIAVCVAPKFQITNLTPWLGAGAGALGRSVYELNLFPEAVLLFLMAPMLQNYKTLRRTYLQSLAISGAVLLFLVLAVTMMIPYTNYSTFYMPVYQITKTISSGEMWQLIQPLFLFVWALNIFCYLAVCLYFLADIFRPNRRGRAIFLFAALLYAAALWQNRLDPSAMLPGFLSASFLVFPLLPLVLAAVAKKGGRA